MKLDRSTADIGAKIAASFAITAAAVVVLSDYVSGLATAQQEGLKIVVPALALIWAVLVPTIQIRLQTREAYRRRDEERQEVRAVAGDLAALAVAEMNRVCQAMHDYIIAKNIDDWNMPENRFEDHIEALNQFDVDNLQHAQSLVSLERLRAILRECQKVVASVPAGPPFGPASAETVMLGITEKVPEANRHVDVISTAKW